MDNEAKLIVRAELLDDEKLLPHVNPFNNEVVDTWKSHVNKEDAYPKSASGKQ